MELPEAILGDMKLAGNETRPKYRRWPLRKLIHRQLFTEALLCADRRLFTLKDYLRIGNGEGGAHSHNK